MSFVDTHDFRAGLVLRFLGIPESTYYDWRARRVVSSRRELEDAEPLERIVKVRSVHEFTATCGPLRVWLELRRQGVHCSLSASRDSYTSTDRQALTCVLRASSTRPAIPTWTPVCSSGPSPSSLSPIGAIKLVRGGLVRYGSVL